MGKINEQEVRKAIELLKPNNVIYEIRAIDGKWNASGYFRGTEDLIRELKKYENKPGINFYITLNTVNDACESRKQYGKLIEKATPTTSDKDINAFEWLMVDLDPERPAGTSSTQEQVELSKKKANEVFKFLRKRGWNDPIVALSGNGTHLLYPIGLSNTQENTSLIKKVLLTLDMLFSDDSIKIDLTTFNAARICKLYGTVAQKGRCTAERPHRDSFIAMSGKVEQIDKSLLMSLVGLLPKAEKPERYNGYNPGSFDLEDWIFKHGLSVTKGTWNGGEKWVFDECPFNSSHTGKDAAIFRMPDGSIGFHCFHNSCSSYTWKDLRLKYEPNAYSKKYMLEKSYPNHEYYSYELSCAEKEKAKNTGNYPVFYTTEQIRLLGTPKEEYIKTGIDMIDKSMRGLRKKAVSCVTGLRGSGKSSWISQLSIEAAEQEYRTAIFSGELTANDIHNWLILQTVGKHYVRETTYENFFVPEDLAKIAASRWLNDKIYIYNNDYGNNFAELMDRLIKCVKDHEVDFIILDNLMSLDISMLDYDKYKSQGLFVQNLTEFAKDANIHIMFAAHPRKAMGFLRLDDVSGSGDITNRVDNAFIIHRANNDFKRLGKQTFFWKDDEPIINCDNVIEVCKDRATGTQDLFVPLYFEKSCKRLKNNKHESKQYGWEDEYVGSGFYGFDEEF